VSPSVFSAISSVDVSTILSLTDAELRPILACLVRMSLIAPLDQSPACLQARTSVLQVLSRIELVNSIVALLSIDFHALEIDVKKEQQLRQKVDGGGESVLISGLTSSPALEFERSDATRKLRLVLSELLALMATTNSGKEAEKAFKLKPSELFDHAVYLPEVCDVLAIALAELPALLQPAEVCEALLRLRYGPPMICQLVANQSDCLGSVLRHLVCRGERQEGGEEPEDGQGVSSREAALLLLCRMAPSLAPTVTSTCVSQLRMPGLAVTLAIEHARDTDQLVAFMSGLLLGHCANTRAWLSQWVRTGQKRRSNSLRQLREELAARVAALLATVGEGEEPLPPHLVRPATHLLRLYTALRGIAGMKFTDSEVSLLLGLITRRPGEGVASTRLTSLSLAMIIAFNSLIAGQQQERRATQWVAALVNNVTAYSQHQGYGELLLLSAIHFHAGQLASVADLVCQTTGIKVTVRTNAMTRVKQIFTQEIFTEKVVAAHAVKVPVTPRLSGNIPGFLPVHCIHQLLKSRAFSKHRVSIKSWIYSQVLHSCLPLHPVLPQLVEVYVASILVPGQGQAAQHRRPNGVNELLNEPLSEEEVRAVFQPPHFNLAALKETEVSSSGYTAQLCMLLYVLLYEDLRLSIPKAGTPASASYSPELLGELPIKLLLAQAERDQASYPGLFPLLLRLAVTHWPQLCLVEDMLCVPPPAPTPSSLPALPPLVPGPSLQLSLRRLLSLPPRLVWSLAPSLCSLLPSLARQGGPLHTLHLATRLWRHLNTVFPRQLALLTVNSLTPPPACTQDDLSLDPLHTLRCTDEVFRCAPILELVLYMLKACLAASRTRLSVSCSSGGEQLSEAEKEELRSCLVLTQESAAIQILLETCSEGPGDKTRGRLSALQEVQSLACSYLHQAFIQDPTLAKLVHFQGYPQTLLPVAAEGVPSMFICLDFVPELLSQPSVEKQVFAVCLHSHLALVCAMPPALSIGRLCVAALHTLLSVLAARERELLITPCLPALHRLCQAFPPLVEDTLPLLIKAGTMLRDTASVRGEEGSTSHILHTFQIIMDDTVFSKKLF